MTLNRKLAITLVSIAQAGLLIAGSPQGAIAASVFSTSDVQKIEKAELVLFGNLRSDLSSESRLRAIETNLFGSHKSGSAQKRLSEVQKLVGDSKPLYLMPPMAATLDTGLGTVMPAPDADLQTNSYDSPTEKLLQEAMAKYSSGDMVSAKKLFLKVSEMDSKSEDAFFNLGVIAESEGDTSSALGYYKKAYALNPSDSELQATVASLSGKIAQESQAKIAQSQEEQRKIKESQDLAYMKRTVAEASNDYKAKRYDQAISKLEAVSAKAPSDPDVLFALGQARRAKGDMKEAKVAFERASSIDPSSQLYRGAVQDVNNDLFSGNNKIAQEYTPAGEITPFTPSPTASSGQGVYQNRGISRIMSGSKVKRALAGGAVGAATGAIYSATTRSSSIKRGALQGALTGAVLGFLSGN